MSQPEGHIARSKNLVYKLKKSLYRLKQSPRSLNSMLDSKLKNLGFTQTKSDVCIYTASEGELFIIAVHIDDIILVGKSEKRIKEVKSMLAQQFEVKHLGIHFITSLV